MYATVARLTERFQIRRVMTATFALWDNVMSMEFAISFGTTCSPAVLAAIAVSTVDHLSTTIPVGRIIVCHNNLIINRE
jgi:hypothetical protein